VAVTNRRTSFCVGTAIRLSTSSNRNSPFFRRLVGTINESYRTECGRSVYSYLQYHWCPIALIVVVGLFSSSIKYRRCRDGSASIIRIDAGIIVQINSVLCASFSVRLENLFEIKKKIM